MVNTLFGFIWPEFSEMHWPVNGDVQRNSSLSGQVGGKKIYPHRPRFVNFQSASKLYIFKTGGWIGDELCFVHRAGSDL